MPGCSVSLTTRSFCSVVNRRRRATPVMTSTFENVSDIGGCLGLCLVPPANAGVRSKQGAAHRRPRPPSATREREILFVGHVDAQVASKMSCARRVTRLDQQLEESERPNCRLRFTAIAERETNPIEARTLSLRCDWTVIRITAPCDILCIIERAIKIGLPDEIF